jgi:GNAT superfamily N-acetyltransferase
MVRTATLNDKTRVIELLKASRIGAGFDRVDGISGFVFPWDAAYAERFFLQHLHSENATVIVHDVDGVAQGVLTALAYEHPYGPVWLAKETMWWIDPSHRGTAALRMLTAFEEWAKSRGCTYAGVAGMGADPDVGVLFQRKGYRPAELHFVKAI